MATGIFILGSFLAVKAGSVDVDRWTHRGRDGHALKEDAL